MYTYLNIYIKYRINYISIYITYILNIYIYIFFQLLHIFLNKQSYKNYILLYVSKYNIVYFILLRL